MKSYRQLEAEFNRRVEELRRRCPHRRLTGWAQEWWAMGHPTAFETRACTFCGKTVRRRTCCAECGAVAEDYREGIGVEEMPLSGYYCPRCFGAKVDLVADRTKVPRERLLRLEGLYRRIPELTAREKREMRAIQRALYREK